MPQLDPEVFSPQLVWLAITFAILYVVMARLALPRIGEVIEGRHDHIAHDLDAAATLKSQAEAALDAYNQSMARTRSEAQGVLARAAEQRAAAAAARSSEFEARIAAQLGEAEARIAKAKARALDDIEGVAGEIARAATEKLIGVAPGGGAVKAVLAAAAKGEGR